MSLPILLVFLAATTLTVLGVAAARRLDARQRGMIARQRLLFDRLAAQREARIRQDARLEQQRIVEKSIEAGAVSAQTIHRTVAGVTFGILNAIPVTEGVSRVVRSVHDGIADTVYSAVRESNKQIGKVAKTYIDDSGPGAAKATGAAQAKPPARSLPPTSSPLAKPPAQGPSPAVEDDPPPGKG